jgi:hypothetical protein
VTDTPRETCVPNAVVPLVDSLFDDFDMAEMLTDLTERCTALLDVAAGGLLLADPRSQLHLMVATSERSPGAVAVRVAGWHHQRERERTPSCGCY